MCAPILKTRLEPAPLGLFIAITILAASAGLAFPSDEALPAAKEQSAPAKATPPSFPNRITTLDGKTYERVALVKVDPDGLLVNYVPAGGGSGCSKLKFRNLPAEWRDRFEYDPDRASEFESAQARGAAAWAAMGAAWSEQRQAAQAEQAAWERKLREETEARLAAEAERDRIEALNSQPAYYYHPGWWGWTVNRKHHGHHPHHPHPHGMHPPPRMPTPGIRSSPVSPFMGPMRPLGR